MRSPRVQLLYFEGCPLTEGARTVLKQALSDCGLAGYEEIDLLDSRTPYEFRGWGSPTILVDGADVTGAPRGDQLGCRVYSTPDHLPERRAVIAAIEAATKREV